MRCKKSDGLFWSKTYDSRQFLWRNAGVTWTINFQWLRNVSVESILNIFYLSIGRFNIPLKIIARLIHMPKLMQTKQNHIFRSTKRTVKKLIQLFSSMQRFKENSENSDKKKKFCKIWFQCCDICDWMKVSFTY